MEDRAMTDRGRLPDALFIRHPEAEADQGLPLVGLLFLLTCTSDPVAMTRCLALQIPAADELPPDDAAMVLWADEADAWPCDLRARLEVQARLADAAVVAVARMDHDDADAAGFVYHEIDPELSADVRASLAEALREAVH
jgi:hypothetical protein